jgi:hypothetical protein
MEDLLEEMETAARTLFINDAPEPALVPESADSSPTRIPQTPHFR